MGGKEGARGNLGSLCRRPIRKVLAKVIYYIYIYNLRQDLTHWRPHQRFLLFTTVHKLYYCTFSYSIRLAQGEKRIVQSGVCDDRYSMRDQQTSPAATLSLSISQQNLVERSRRFKANSVFLDTFYRTTESSKFYLKKI